MLSEPSVWQRVYDNDGFVIVHDLLDPVTLSRLLDRLENIMEHRESLTPSLKEKLFLERDHVKNNPQYYAGLLTAEECGDAVRQIEDLALFDPAFAGCIYYPSMLDVLEALFRSSEFSFNYLIARPKAARVGNGISNGNFHRDTPFEEFTYVNTAVVILCLNDMMAENGATQFIRGSHQVSDEEAKKAKWREVEEGKVNLDDKVAVRCGAGAGIFFNTKILHAAGPNRSADPRYTILAEWVGPDVLPTSPIRYAYQGLKPRSKDPAYQRQLTLSFPGANRYRIADPRGVDQSFP